MGNGIRIRSSSEETGEKRRPVAALLFLYAGVCGMISFLHALEGISFSAWAVYVAAAVLCGLIWYCYGRKKAFLLLVLVSAMLCQTAVFLMGNTFHAQAAHMVECIADGGTAEPMSVTETAVLLTVAVSFVMAVFEFLMKSHFVLYLLTTGLLLLSPLLGVRAGVGEILLIALFQAAFWAMEIADLVHGRGGFSGKRSLSGKSGIAAGLLLAAVFLIVFPAVAAHTEGLYGVVYDAEGEVYRAMSRLSGRAGEPVKGGKIGRGNNYRTGTAHLELEASVQPSETLYLRGFGGGEYTGGDWIRSSDEALFANIMGELDWRGNRVSIASGYYGMYFVMNSSMRRDEEELPEAVTLSVRHCNGVYDNTYVPYYSQRSSGWYNSYGYGSRREGYVFQYYEQKDMMIDWDNVSEGLGELRDWYRLLQKDYMEEARTAYTQVPESLLPRLTELCRKNPQGSLEEITAFILYTLHSNASYTLTPGWAPLNEDIVEYFLFESGRGYCEHFAVTATLMYRLYGVPARYATGYMVSPSDFELQEDGTWKAVVTDESAQAWAEIFLEDYGWTPVEVTPASDGSSAAAYPGFDSSVLEKIIREENWSMNRPGMLLPDTEGIEDGLGNAGAKEDFSFDFAWNFEKYEKWFYVLGTCIVYSLCLLPFFLDYRRLRRLRKLEGMGCRKIFSRLLQVLHFAGILEGYDGTEEDFAEKLAGLTGITREEIAKMQEIVCEAAYGFTPPAPEKEECVRKTYLRLAKAVYGTLKWHRKMILRNIKALV